MPLFNTTEDQKRALWAALGQFGGQLSAGASTQGWGALAPAASAGIAGFADTMAAQREKQRQDALKKELADRHRAELKAALADGQLTPKQAAAAALYIGRDKFDDVMSGALMREEKKPEGFTLSPGQSRFGADGKPIAAVPKEKPAAKPKQIKNFTDGTTRELQDDGTWKVLSSKPAATTKKKDPPAPMSAIDRDNEAFKRAQNRMKNEVGRAAPPEERASAWNRILDEERSSVERLTAMGGVSSGKSSVVGGAVAKAAGPADASFNPKEPPPASLQAKVGKNKVLAAIVAQLRIARKPWSEIEAMLDAGIAGAAAPRQ